MANDETATLQGAVFLLSIESTPSFELRDAKGPAASGQRQDFRELVIAADVPDGDTRQRREYVLQLGDFLLLRPPHSGSAPYVGRAKAFFRDGRARNVRVQWFYRPCEILEKPRHAYGEDEVLETPVFGNVDVDTIVGRCTVTDYSEYTRLMHEEQNVSAIREVESGIVNPSSQGPEAIHEGSQDREDDAASEGSIFEDHYAASSTRLFCREYYDAAQDAIATAEFDDPSADPSAEIADAFVDDDAELYRDSEESNTDDEEFSEDDIENDDSIVRSSATGSGKRKRTRRRQRDDTTAPKRLRRRDVRSDVGSLQFSLPQAIARTPDLPCRDVEKARVESFLVDAVKESRGAGSRGDRCLYISGVPGTGKTATVREVIRKLQERMQRGELPQFEAIEVNGMALPDPNIIYSELFACLAGVRGVTPARAALLLEKRLRADATHKPTVARGARAIRNVSKCVVLLLDEMDVLVSRKQQLLYDLLEWTTRPSARLVLIGIANTMDLPERLLPRLASRMGNNRITYAPYTRNQLLEILDKTVREDDTVYDESAMRLIAAKVASVSGDVRRAHELCRRSREVAEEERHGATNGVSGSAVQVTSHHVNAAVADMTGESRLQVVRGLADLEKLVLVCTIALSRSAGAFDVDASSSLGVVFAKAREVASSMGHTFPAAVLRSHALETAVASLVATRVLLLERDVRRLQTRMIVNLSPDDCMFALMDDEIAKHVLHQTGQAFG